MLKVPSKFVGIFWEWVFNYISYLIFLNHISTSTDFRLSNVLAWSEVMCYWMRLLGMTCWFLQKHSEWEVTWRIISRATAKTFDIGVYPSPPISYSSCSILLSHCPACDFSAERKRQAWGEIKGQVLWDFLWSANREFPSICIITIMLFFLPNGFSSKLMQAMLCAPSRRDQSTGA